MILKWCSSQGNCEARFRHDKARYCDCISQSGIGEDQPGPCKLGPTNKPTPAPVKRVTYFMPACQHSGCSLFRMTDEQTDKQT